MLAQFVDITGSDEGAATEILRAHNWDFSTAITLFFESQTGNAPTSATAQPDEPVPMPVHPTVDPPSAQAMETQGPARQVIDVEEEDADYSPSYEAFAGRRVILRNLRAIPELNGEEGECGEFDATRQRHPVTLDNGRVVAVKMENLELAPSVQGTRSTSRAPQQHNPIVISDDDDADDDRNGGTEAFSLARSRRSGSRDADMLDGPALARPSRQERRAAQRRERRQQQHNNHQQWMDFAGEEDGVLPRTGAMDRQSPAELNEMREIAEAAGIDLEEAAMMEAAFLGGGQNVTEAMERLQRSHEDRIRQAAARPWQPAAPTPLSPGAEARLNLRAEQDLAYQEALEQDRQKELERRVEENRARQEEEDQQRLAVAREEAQKREAEELEQVLKRKRDELPPEPEPDNADITVCMVRMPDGQRISRRFLKTDPLEKLFDLIDVECSMKPNSYKLVTSFPRRTFTYDMAAPSFVESGLGAKQEAFFVEMN